MRHIKCPKPTPTSLDEQAIQPKSTFKMYSYFNHIQSQMPRYSSHQVVADANTNKTSNSSSVQATTPPVSNTDTPSPNSNSQSDLAARFNAATNHHNTHYHLPMTLANALQQHPLLPFQPTPSVSPVELTSSNQTPAYTAFNTQHQHRLDLAKHSSARPHERQLCRARKSKDSDGKTKRIRTCYTPYQLKVMEESFACQIYLVNESRTNLAAELNLSETQVKVWFQNRRIKQRKLDAIAEAKNITPSKQQ